jgi:hypothetical protein
MIKRVDLSRFPYYYNKKYLNLEIIEKKEKAHL